MPTSVSFPGQVGGTTTTLSSTGTTTSAGTNIQNLGQAVTAAGGAASDLFSSIGSGQSAQAYGQAAAEAGNNASIALTSGGVTLYNQTLAQEQTLGAQQAQEAGAGFTEGGSGLALLSSGRQQAGLANAMTGLQTYNNVTGYLEQQQAYLQDQKSAEAASHGSLFGAILGAIGVVASIALDVVTWGASTPATIAAIAGTVGTVATEASTIASDVSGTASSGTAAAPGVAPVAAAAPTNTTAAAQPTAQSSPTLALVGQTASTQQ